MGLSIVDVAGTTLQDTHGESSLGNGSVCGRVKGVRPHPDVQSGPLNQQRKQRSLRMASGVLQMSWKQPQYHGHQNNSREER